MGTHSQHRSYGLLLPMIAMAFAALVVIVAGWLILSLFLAAGQYIESVPLP